MEITPGRGDTETRRHGENRRSKGLQYLVKYFLWAIMALTALRKPLF